VVEVSDDGRMVHASIELPGVAPREAIRAFTDPALLLQWWGGQLETEAKPGGPYVVHFEGLGRTLQGEVVGYDPESELTFTWAWDYEADPPRREVKVRAVPTGDAGTRVEIEHGPHGDSADELEEAKAHRDGWEFFLPQLAASLSGAQQQRA
jgi:uncharacterized protein YndB with AHSA1/START domain